MESPYDVLGVDPDADDGEVVDAYRRRVKEVHPDQGGTVREFRAVQRAYERIRAGEVPDPEADAAETTRPTREERSGYGPSRREPDPEPEPEPEPERSRVEYLNYEVLDDHGWDLNDDDLFEKAANADLDPEDYGEFVVGPDESLLEAAENSGFAWPFACRGGACTNCAVALKEGEIPPPVSHVLSEEMLDRGIRLSCITTPSTESAKVVYNAKHLPDVHELLLPASRFERAHDD